MNRNNALGLTLSPETEVYDLPSSADSDSVTIISLQSLFEQNEGSSLPLKLLNRWRCTGSRVLSQGLWPARCASPPSFYAYSPRHPRLSTGVRSLRRRLPAFLHSIAASITSNVPGITPKQLTTVSHPVLSAPTYVFPYIRDSI